MTAAAFRQLALSFPEVSEQPHFEKTSFRVKKKIFATYDEAKSLACLKLTANDQYIFTTLGKEAIYAVPNKWGGQGWTFVEVNRLPKKVLCDALKAAYNHTMEKKVKKT